MPRGEAERGDPVTAGPVALPAETPVPATTRKGRTRVAYRKRCGSPSARGRWAISVKRRSHRWWRSGSWVRSQSVSRSAWTRVST